MEGPSQTGKHRLISASARLFFRLVVAAALLLVLIALWQGVTEVGFSGIVLLGTAAALVVGYGLRLVWPLLLSVGRRFPVRFGLRTLLITTLACGVSLAWLGNKARDVREQRQILRQVFAGGFSVGVTDWYSDRMPHWVYRWFGLSAQSLRTVSAAFVTTRQFATRTCVH